MYYVYILRSLKDNKKFYIGCTGDLKKRMLQHNNGESFSTAPRRPFRLFYYEAYLDRRDAEEREKFFKTGWGRNYIKKTMKHSLQVKI